MTTQAQSLYRRWRPQTFEDVIGQDHITRTLRNAVAGDRLAHAYLFTGPRGTGKTSVARILAKAVNCTGEGEKPCNACPICVSMTEGRALDLIEIDAASNTGVDDVRDLRDKISFAPNEATYKVYIIDEVHMLSTAAFNALLKTLEEPPPHAFFILATTEPHKVPETIASRCQQYDFRRVPVDAIVAKLERICLAEGVEAEPEALIAIARAATGSIRDAESLLDQLMASGERITADSVREVLGTPADAAVSDMVDALVALDAGSGLRIIARAMDQGVDARQLRSVLLDYMRRLLLLKAGAGASLVDLSDAQVERARQQSDAWTQPALVAALRRFAEAQLAPDVTLPALPLELAFVETVMAMQPEASAEARAEPKTRSRTAAPVAASPKAAASDARETPAPKREGGASRSARAPRRSAGARPSDRAPKPEPGKGRSEPTPTPEPSQPAARPDADKRRPDSEPASGADVARATPTAPLERARGLWPEIIEAVKQTDTSTAALLRDGRPVALDGETLTVGFFYDFHCKKVSEVDRSTLVAARASDLLGRRVSLQCTVVPAEKEDREERPRTVTDQVKKDPVVSHAINELGARVASVTRQNED